MKYDEFYNINDFYNIKRELAEAKALLGEIEEDVEVFLSPKKSKKRGSAARTKIAKLKNKLLTSISSNILKTNQDYKSDYS